MEAILQKVKKITENRMPYQEVGKVISGQGLVYQTHLPNASIGATVLFSCENGEESEGEVVSINDRSCFCIPYMDLAGINRHTKIYLKSLQT